MNRRHLRTQLAMIAFLFVLGFITMFGQVSSSIQVPLRTPDDIPVLVNGRFAKGEWDKAEALKMKGSLILYLKQDSHFLYLGIRFLGEMHTGIDLYVTAAGQDAKKLHVSSALGEAKYEMGVWGDIQWGKNLLWSCNSIGLIYEEGKQKVVSLEGFEFQISKLLFPGQSWRIFLHLKRPELKVPAGGAVDNMAGWLKIRL